MSSAGMLPDNGIDINQSRALHSQQVTPYACLPATNLPAPVQCGGTLVGALRFLRCVDFVQDDDQHIACREATQRPPR